MHIPDGFIDGTTALTTGAVSLGGAAYAARRAQEDLGDRAVPVLGVTAAFVFAAQMVNFPVAGGTSGHLLGGALSAVLLGPWAAVIVMTVVVALQAVVMNDGGITALGANVLNMALVGALGGWMAFRLVRRILGSSRERFLAAVAGAAWLSVVLGAAAASLEFGLSGTVPLGVALPAMTSVHMIIGVGEAVVTVAVVGAVLAARPDLVRAYDGRRPATGGPDRPGLGRRWGFVAAALAVSLAVAVFLSPFASSMPDGLERVAEDNGFAELAEDPPIDLAPLADYSFPGLDGGLGVAAAGLAGTLLVFTLAFGAGRLAGRAGGAPGAPSTTPNEHGSGHGVLEHRHSGHTHAQKGRSGDRPD
ncbi:MAG: energy-coupling factor ABC transporter permease [Thermoleophilia bacterium]